MEFEDGLTPRQLAELLELINNQLARYWLDDKRVQVVRLAIQVAKMIEQPGEAAGERLEQSQKLQ